MIFIRLFGVKRAGTPFCICGGQKPISQFGLKSYLYEQGRIPECSNFIFILTGYPLDVNTPVNLLKLTKLY